MEAAVTQVLAASCLWLQTPIWEPAIRWTISKPTSGDSREWHRTDVWQRQTSSRRGRLNRTSTWLTAMLQLSVNHFCPEQVSHCIGLSLFRNSSWFLLNIKELLILEFYMNQKIAFQTCYIRAKMLASMDFSTSPFHFFDILNFSQINSGQIELPLAPFIWTNRPLLLTYG